jgi:hypothetical protein
MGLEQTEEEESIKEAAGEFSWKTHSQNYVGMKRRVTYRSDMRIK